MFTFFSVVLLLMPLTMIMFGCLWKRNPPRKINMLYGYRTERSMKSQETWDFAHKYFGVFWLYIGIASAILSMVLLCIFNSLTKTSLVGFVPIIIVIQLTAMILPIIFTEAKLKENFDENGHKKPY